MYEEPFQLNLTQEELTVLQAAMKIAAQSPDFDTVLDTLSSLAHKVENPLDLNQ